MYTKSIAALVGAVAVVQQAAAFNVHRPQHKLEKKAEVVNWVTHYETVYITDGTNAPKATPKVAAEAVVVQPSPLPQTQAPAPAPAPAPTSVPSPASSSHSPSPSSTPADSGSSSGGNPGFSGKRGMGYNDASLANFFGESSGKCSWAYNWADSPGDLDSKYSFIPTLWGDKNDFLSRWSSAASTAISKGSKALFSFNEPDNAGQANMSPSDAASLHVQHMNPFAGKALIGAPAVSNSNLAGQGLQWLQSFMTSCQGAGCHVDFCNVHWYSPANEMDSLFDLLEQAHQICGNKPVWLTEFAPTGSSDEINNFLNVAIPKLEALDYVTGYAYFFVDTGKLLDSANSLSSVGQVYASS